MTMMKEMQTPTMKRMRQGPANHLHNSTVRMCMHSSVRTCGWSFTPLPFPLPTSSLHFNPLTYLSSPTHFSLHLISPITSPPIPPFTSSFTCAFTVPDGGYGEDEDCLNAEDEEYRAVLERMESDGKYGP